MKYQHRVTAAQAAARAAQRRRLLAWLERLEELNRRPARTHEEKLAKAEALDRLHQARPD